MMTASLPASGALRAPAAQGTVVEPAPGDPSIVEPLVRSGDRAIALFGDDVWPLGAIGVTPGGHSPNLNFRAVPDTFRESVKLFAYLTINRATPDEVLAAEGSAAVERPSAETIRQLVSAAKSLVTWLLGRGVADMSQVDAHHLDEYRVHVRGRTDIEPASKNRLLATLIRWAALSSELPEAHRCPRPTWADEAWAFPRRPPNGDNATARIKQSVMAPLLSWALLVNEQIAPDAVTAASASPIRTDRPNAQQSKADRVRAVFEHYKRNGGTVPGSEIRDGKVAVDYLRWAHALGDITAVIISVIFGNEYAGDLSIDSRPEATRIDSSLTGRIAGRKWTDGIGFYDIHVARPGGGEPPLIAFVRTACLIVIAYLTGMRSDEVRTLERGCLSTDSPDDAGVVRYRISGTVAKRRDLDTDEVTQEKNRKPATWATVKAAADAVGILEALPNPTGSTYLFPGPRDSRSPSTNANATVLIQRFIDRVNQTLVPLLSDPSAGRIEPDSAGAVTLPRFRRTLAWFIRNQPGGNVTLAVQYQHLATTMGEGYAGTQAAGLTELLDEEGLVARQRLLIELRRETETGLGVSGPAADRALWAAAEVPEASFLGDREVRRTLKTTPFQVYDNPAAVALCVDDPSKRLCQKMRLAGKIETPNLLGCHVDCLNLATTDRHADELRRRIAEKQAQADHSPQPLRLKYEREIAELEQRIAAHESGRHRANLPITSTDDGLDSVSPATRQE